MTRKPPHKVSNFTREDIRTIFRILTLVEIEYKEEAPKHESSRQLMFLATARGASIGKKRIREFLKGKYNITSI